MVQPKLSHVGSRESTALTRGTASRSAVWKTSSAGARREAAAAMTDLLGDRHIMIPAGVPWLA
jgi:hypothetical protein